MSLISIYAVTLVFRYLFITETVIYYCIWFFENELGGVGGRLSQNFAICRCQPVALSVAPLLSQEKIFSVSALI